MTKRSIAARASWFAAMQEQFAGARFQEAGGTYDEAIAAGERASVEAQLLRARLFLKEDENKAAAFLLKSKPEHASAHQRGIWSLYLGTAFARMRDFQAADHHFDAANQKLTDRDDLATLAYHRSRRFLLEGRFDEARAAAEAVAIGRSDTTKIDLELLQSFILSQEELYSDQAGSLLRAIRLIGSRREAYLEQWFHAVQNLAILGRELPIEELGAMAKGEVDLDIMWPSDFLSQRFQALKAVGWTLALQGDALGCFRYLRLAESVAPNDAFRTIVLLDRSHFAKSIGERAWALNELAIAEEIAERVDWNAVGGEQRVGLLLLAESCAETDHEKARYYMARYAGLDRIRSPLHLIAFDHRIEAYAAYTDGVVRLAAGDAGAEDVLRKAWIIFDRIGYDWRAGRTALRLYAVTGKERWLHLAEDKLERYGRSWLGEELRRAKVGVSGAVQLPVMQSKVFELLCRQMSTAEIAQSLGLSEHTVRNHLKSVFKAYGVNNRAALIAEAAKRGEFNGTKTV